MEFHINKFYFWTINSGLECVTNLRHALARAALLITCPCWCDSDLSRVSRADSCKYRCLAAPCIITSESAGVINQSQQFAAVAFSARIKLTHTTLLWEKLPSCQGACARVASVSFVCIVLVLWWHLRSCLKNALICFAESVHLYTHTHTHTHTHTPWPQSASELYRPSDRRLSTKLMPSFCR
jgi:hypothetical protein